MMREARCRNIYHGELVNATCLVFVLVCLLLMSSCETVSHDTGADSHDRSVIPSDDERVDRTPMSSPPCERGWPVHEAVADSEWTAIESSTFERRCQVEPKRWRVRDSSGVPCVSVTPVDGFVGAGERRYYEARVRDVIRLQRGDQGDDGHREAVAFVVTRWDMRPLFEGRVASWSDLPSSTSVVLEHGGEETADEGGCVLRWSERPRLGVFGLMACGGGWLVHCREDGRCQVVGRGVVDFVVDGPVVYVLYGHRDHPRRTAVLRSFFVDEGEGEVEFVAFDELSLEGAGRAMALLGEGLVVLVREEAQSRLVRIGVLRGYFGEVEVRRLGSVACRDIVAWEYGLLVGCPGTVGVIDVWDGSQGARWYVPPSCRGWCDGACDGP